MGPPFPSRVFRLAPTSEDEKLELKFFPLDGMVKEFITLNFYFKRGERWLFSLVYIDYLRRKGWEVVDYYSYYC